MRASHKLLQICQVLVLFVLSHSNMSVFQLPCSTTQQTRINSQKFNTDMAISEPLPCPRANTSGMQTGRIFIIKPQKCMPVLQLTGPTQQSRLTRIIQICIIFYQAPKPILHSIKHSQALFCSKSSRVKINRVK